MYKKQAPYVNYYSVKCITTNVQELQKAGGEYFFTEGGSFFKLFFPGLSDIRHKKTYTFLKSTLRARRKDTTRLQRKIHFCLPTFLGFLKFICLKYGILSTFPQKCLIFYQWELFQNFRSSNVGKLRN